MVHIEVSPHCVAIVGISGADTMLYLVRCEMEEKKRNVTAYSLGCVYAVEFGNVVKIGFTTNFEKRIKSLKQTFRYRNEKRKIGKTYCSNEMHYATRAEAFLHERFKERRIEHTELFRITFEEAEKAIKEVEQLKLYSDEDWERLLEAERISDKMFNSIFIDNVESEEENKELVELTKENAKLADDVNKAYKKQIELLTEFKLRTMRILAGLCNDVDYRDWLLSNPAFIEYINDEYAKLTTARLLEKSPAD